MGIAISYGVSEFHKVELFPSRMVSKDGLSLYFKEFDHNPYFARLLLNEFLHSFTFISVFLIVKYKPSF